MNQPSSKEELPPLQHNCPICFVVLQTRNDLVAHVKDMHDQPTQEGTSRSGDLGNSSNEALQNQETTSTEPAAASAMKQSPEPHKKNAYTEGLLGAMKVNEFSIGSDERNAVRLDVIHSVYSLGYLNRFERDSDASECLSNMENSTYACFNKTPTNTSFRRHINPELEKQRDFSMGYSDGCKISNCLKKKHSLFSEHTAAVLDFALYSGNIYERQKGGILYKLSKYFLQAYTATTFNPQPSTSKSEVQTSVTTAEPQPIASTFENLPTISTTEPQPAASSFEYLPTTSAFEQLLKTSSTEPQPTASTFKHLPTTFAFENLTKTSTFKNVPTASSTETQPTKSASEHLPTTSVFEHLPTTSVFTNVSTTSSTEPQPSASTFEHWLDSIDTTPSPSTTAPSTSSGHSLKRRSQDISDMQSFNPYEAASTSSLPTNKSLSLTGPHFACSVCGNEYGELQFLQGHETQIHQKGISWLSSDGTIQCELCRERFKDLNDLVIHQRDQHTFDPFCKTKLNALCHICPLSFTSDDVRNEHIMTVHRSEAGIFCLVLLLLHLPFSEIQTQLTIQKGRYSKH